MFRKVFCFVLSICLFTAVFIILPVKVHGEEEWQWKASEDFCSTQGENQWYYKQLSNGTYSDLTWTSEHSKWLATTIYGCTISSDRQQPISGLAELIVSGTPGTEILLEYRERSDNFNPQYESAGQKHVANKEYVLSGRFQTDKYILKGDGVETWRPRFTYHGFRFVKLKYNGEVNDMPMMHAIILHTDMSDNGKFICSDTVLNDLQLNCRRSYLYNYHGFPTDCATREKAGWAGDGHLTVPQAFYNFNVFDVANCYKKWMKDLSETQLKNGRISVIAPTAGWGYRDEFGPCWLNTYIILPEMVFKFMGDDSLVKVYYQSICKLYAYYEQAFKQGKFKNMLGDWLRPYSLSASSNDGELYNMAALYQASCILLKYSRIVGEHERELYYNQKMIGLRESFNEVFLDKDEATYGSGSQSELSIALALGLVPDKYVCRVLKRLLLEIEHCNGHLDTGIHGTRFLFETLFKYGYPHVALSIMKKHGYPGFVWWLDNGATTMWERWNGTGSLNHAVYSYISEFFYSGFAGIVPGDGDDECGCRKVLLKPALISGLERIHCSFDSPLGTIKMEWEKKGDTYIVYGCIPYGCRADLYLPESANTEVWRENKNIKLHETKQDVCGIRYAIYKIKSGNFYSKSGGWCI